MPRYLVVFGFEVDAKDQEEARLKAKENLAYPDERKSVDYFRCKRLSDRSNAESRDKDYDL